MSKTNCQGIEINVEEGRVVTITKYNQTLNILFSVVYLPHEHNECSSFLELLILWQGP